MPQFEKSDVVGGPSLPASLSILQNFISQNVVDNSIGTFYEGNRFIIQSLDFQSLNTFEVILSQRKNFKDILTPTVYKFGNPTDYLNDFLSPDLILSDALNLAVTRLHLRSLSFPLPKLEYVNVLHTKRVININHPDTVTFSFLEDEFGTVRKFVELWFKLIVNRQPTGLYTFKDKQLRAEKEAIILLQNGSGLPTPLYAMSWLKMEGLKIESTNDYTLAHDARDLMIIEIVCAVDNIWWFTLGENLGDLTNPQQNPFSGTSKL